MRCPTEHDKLSLLMESKQFAEIDADALEAKYSWAYDALMQASKQMEEIRSGNNSTYKVNQFECNLCDAAVAYTKATRLMKSAYRKVARIEKKIEKLRTKQDSLKAA